MDFQKIRATLQCGTTRMSTSLELTVGRIWPVLYYIHSNELPTSSHFILFQIERQCLLSKVTHLVLSIKRSQRVPHRSIPLAFL